jgi:hypothetical protein
MHGFPPPSYAINICWNKTQSTAASLIMSILKMDMGKVSEMLDSNSVFRWQIAREFNANYEGLSSKPSSNDSTTSNKPEPFGWVKEMERCLCSLQFAVSDALDTEMTN